MNFSVGIIGLPNAGKSTLFNALVKKQQAEAAKHPFTTIEPNRAVVEIPDDKLPKLVGIIKKDTFKGVTLQGRQPEVVPAAIAFVDIAGLVKGAHKGEGLGNQFLGHIRDVSVILHVLRGFEDSTVLHVEGDIDPERDREIVETELVLADLTQVDKVLSERKKHPEEKRILEKLRKHLDSGKPISSFSPQKDEKELFSKFFFLTNKPVVYVINVGESKLQATNYDLQTDSIPICAKLEQEFTLLPEDEQREFLKEYGLKTSALETVIMACFEKLDLVRFYTIAKGKQARSWLIRRGSAVLTAAETVHTDFGKKFIKAEVIGIDELLVIGSWNSAKTSGKIRQEGRGYNVQNGDVIEFRVGT